MSRQTTYSALYDLAEGQDGYFSAYQADAAGIPPTTLQRATVAGFITRASRGVYRLKHYPVTSLQAHLWEAVLWPQVRKPYIGTISHYTALRLHDLSDVNPEQTHIIVPTTLRARRTPPLYLVVHRADLEPYDVTFVNGLPTTTVARTLLDIAKLPNPAVLHDALRDARRRKFEIPRELANV
jgi:predicted transcriptional regulator of viral defense system